MALMICNWCHTHGRVRRKLTEAESMELQRRVNARVEQARSARHARPILLSADGTWSEIRAKFDCSDSCIDP